MLAPNERRWYKTTTLGIAFAGLLLTSLSVVYYRRVDEHRGLVRALNDKIKVFQDRLDTINSVPTVAVALKTLITSGLPASAFSSLPSVPSVIEITHVSGDTARGITVRLNMATSVISVVPYVSIDQLKYSISKDKHAITFDVPELRRGEVVGAAVTQRGLSEITETSRIDVGQIMEDVPPSKADDAHLSSPIEVDSKFEYGFMNPEKALELSVDDFTTRAALMQAITDLKQVRGHTEEEPIWGWQFSAVCYGLLAMASSWCLFVFPVDLWDFIKKKRTEAALNGNALRVGMKKSDLESQGWNRNRSIYRIEGNGDRDEVWIYEPYDKLFIRKETLGAELLFSGDTLATINLLRRT